MKHAQLIYVDKNGHCGDAEDMYVFSRATMTEEQWDVLTSGIERLCDPFLRGTAEIQTANDFAYDFGETLEEFRTLGINESSYVITKSRDDELKDFLSVGF